MANPNLPPTTHNLPPAGHIYGAPDALQVYSIESFRDKQAVELTDALHREEINQGRMLTDDERRAIRNAEYAKYDGEIEAYLQAHGIDTTHPDFATYSDKLKELSINNISPSEWNVSPVDPNDSSNLLPSPRDTVMDDLATKFAAPATPTAPPAPAPTTPLTTPVPTTPGPASIAENPAMHMALDRARTELAHVTAQRQGSFNLLRRGTREKEFDLSRNEYEEKVIDLVRDELQKEIAAGNYPDEADQRLYVAARLMDSYKELQEATNEAMANTKMGKFIRFMTSGGTVKRVMKGVVVGAAAGAVGAGITAVTGGVAGVGVAAGVAAAARMARGYATFDARAGRGVQAIEVDDAKKREMLRESGVETGTIDFAIDKLSYDLMERLGDETKTEISKRRKSFGKAALLVAGSAAVVEAINYGYDAMTSHGSSSGGTPQSGGSEPGGTEPGGRHEPTPGEKPGGAAPEAPKPIEYNSDALTISNGEGFYQTFQEMDIPQKDWAELLDKVGPELNDMQVHGHSLAYRMPNGEWGIRMTADGQMPRGALDAITEAHNQMTGQGTGVGGVESSTSTGGAGVSPEATTPDASSAASATPEVTTGSSAADIGSLVRQTDISAADIEGNSAIEAITHVSPNLSPEGLGQRLNLPASEWARLQEYIVGETNGGNKLYTSIFDVNGNGYLRFTGNQIPAGTMADMLMHISPSVRYGLAA